MNTQKPLVKNAADEGQGKSANLKQKLQRETELNDVRSILSSTSGRRFLWRYLSECGVYSLSFDHSGSITAFNEGKRSIGLRLIADVTEASPEAYMQMMKENKGDNDV